MNKLLVIEDDNEARENIIEFLSYKNFDVLSASNAKKGMRLAMEEFPDLIICDIMLPDSDGFQILESLRKNPSTFTTPFIFLTARTAEPDLRKGMNLGAEFSA
jgi:DNA-binding response OmpR family regulator